MLLHTKAVRYLEIAMRQTLISLLVGLLLGSWQQAASADPYGGDAGVCSTESTCWNESWFQRWWYDAGVPGKWVDAANWDRRNNVDPTHMDTALRDLHENSDVSMYHEKYGAPWSGLTPCIDDGAGEICHHWHVMINDDFDYAYSEKQSLACHEFGHSAGLWHLDSHAQNGTCMENPHWHLYYSDHNINHVNTYFPNQN